MVDLLHMVRPRAYLCRQYCLCIASAISNKPTKFVLVLDCSFNPVHYWRMVDANAHCSCRALNF